MTDAKKLTVWERLHLANEIIEQCQQGVSKDRAKATYEHIDHTLSHPVSLQIYTLAYRHAPMALKVTVLALEHAEESMFATISSINSKDKDRLLKIGDIGKLASVDLLNHTYHVVEETLTYTDKLGLGYPTLFCLALFHDFGKSDQIKDRMPFPSAWIPHEQISAHYAQKILLECGYHHDFAHSIFTLLNTHHNYKGNNRLVTYLNECDMKARRRELSLL